MWQFILGSNEAFTALEARARRSCVLFREQEMPPGAVPAHATIAFEVDPASGVACLFVERGVTYEGSSDEIRSWLASGQRRFRDFRELRSWITTTIRAVFLATATAPSQGECIREPGEEDVSGLELNDVDSTALRIAMRQIGRKRDLPS